MLHNPHIQQTVENSRFTLNILVVLIVLGFGIAIGWILHSRSKKAEKETYDPKEIIYDFEEWEGQDGYHQYRQFVRK